MRSRRRHPGSEYTTLTTFALLAAAQLSDALSIPSIWPRQIHSLPTSSLWRRSSSKVKIPEAISIAPSQAWNGNDGPWSSFPIQVGSGNEGGLQDVMVMPSTAATNIWTIGPDGCPPGYVADCAHSRGFLFYTNESLTWTPLSIYETGLEQNLGMNTNGLAGFDVATLGWQGSGGPTDDHAVVFNLASSDYWIGVFGLNPRPTNFTTFTDPQTSFLQALYDNKSIPSVSYGYTAGNQYRLNSVFGSLTLGGYDANRFVPNNVTFDFFTDISRDLLVNLQSISAKETSPTNLLPDGSIPIFIDSTVAEMWLPKSACAEFEKAFGLEYNKRFNRYLITAAQRQKLLNQGAEVTFTISPNRTGGDKVDITLPYSAFDLQVSYPIVADPNTSYYFPLQPAENVTQYTLGRTFLQEAYLIADYGRQNFSVSPCDWTAEKVANQNIVSILSANALKDSQKSTIFTIPVIVGIIVGIVALIALLTLILIILRRKKNKEKRRLAELEAKEAELRAADEKPIISKPMGGELSGVENQIHEMNAPNKPFVAEMETPNTSNRSGPGYSEMDAGAREYYAKHGYVVEMQGTTPVYEMSGSDVFEMPAQVLTPMQELPPRVPPKDGWI